MFYISVRFLLLVFVCFALFILSQVVMPQNEVCSCLGQHIAHFAWFSWFLSASQDIVQ